MANAIEWLLVEPIWHQLGAMDRGFRGGRAWNSAPGQKDYDFGGMLLSRPITDRLILGGAVFGRGADSVDGEHTTLVTFGGYYTPPLRCGECHVLFDVGHSVAGETHTIGYLGLYWTWGPGGRS